MRILHISDTHGYHNLLNIEGDRYDLIIHSGDGANTRDPYRNEHEMDEFLTWFASLKSNYKIYVAGNHDSSIERGLIKESDFKNHGIYYLQNDYIYVEGFKIWGSPYTPSFNDWAFMKNRDKMYKKVWAHVPEDTDILVTHGPPRGILDLSEDKDRKLERCGDRSLRKVVERINPSLCLFGHIHGFKDIDNYGVRTISQIDTTFSNAALFKDNEFGDLLAHGNEFNL